jgi:hypothetical protein
MGAGLDEAGSPFFSSMARCDDGASSMAHSDDFKLIREIVAAGGRKHTIGTLDRAKYQRLLSRVGSSHSRHPPATCLIWSPNGRSSRLTRLNARVPEWQIGLGELRLVTTGSDRRRDVADLKRLDELASIGRDFRDRADIVAERWRQAQALASLQIEKSKIDAQRRHVEADVGPPRYLAACQRGRYAPR